MNTLFSQCKHIANKLLNSYHIIGNIFIDREEVIFVVNESYTHEKVYTKYCHGYFMHQTWNQLYIAYSLDDSVQIILIDPKSVLCYQIWMSQREREREFSRTLKVHCQS